MSYRSFEDKHGFIKHFGNRDIEYEVVMAGLDSLVGSEKWGKRARELQQRYLVAFDGLFFNGVREDRPDDTPLIKEMLDGLRCAGQFITCDELQFRRVHNDCMVFFREVKDAYALLMVDDRRT